MREGLNKVILIGNLGQDPELKNAGGQDLLKLRIATTERYKTKATGEWTERTEWHSVVMGGKRAEPLSHILTKGRAVCIEGSIQYRQYEAKDGTTRYATDIRAHNLILLGGKPQRETRDMSGGGGFNDFPPDDFGDDDVPF